ncbi:hypothetical protein [Clostridium sp. SGI.024]|uniref:hypothetical protein n=1 Tax=Clostridium sp. SGI.024 TaxID=3420551 RepID=UPI003CFE329F
MKKFSKIIVLTLVMVFMSVNSSQVFAATNKKAESIITYEEAIKIIEENYLSLDSNGNFKIDSKAKDVIPEEIYNTLKSGTENINTEINNDNLEVSSSFQGYEVKPVKGSKLDAETYSDANSFNAYSSRTYNPPVIDNYTFFWWGYIAEANETAAQIMINELELLIAVSGGVGTIAGYFTVGVTVALSVAVGVGCYGLITQIKNSLEITSDGVTIYAYGSPEKGQVYKVTQLYN